MKTYQVKNYFGTIIQTQKAYDEIKKQIDTMRKWNPPPNEYDMEFMQIMQLSLDLYKRREQRNDTVTIQPLE